MNTKGDLRIWWIPQAPMKPFIVSVKDLEQAAFLLKVLVHYDQFQFDNNVKPDYCNAGGLEEFDGEEWLEWEDKNGDNINEWTDKQRENEKEIA